MYRRYFNVSSLPTFLTCFRNKTLSSWMVGSSVRFAASRCRAGTLECSLKRGRKSRTNLLASPVVEVPATRSSVTSLS